MTSLAPWASSSYIVDNSDICISSAAIYLHCGYQFFHYQLLLRVRADNLLSPSLSLKTLVVSVLAVP